MKLINKKLMPSYNRIPISFEKGKGVWVFDKSKNKPKAGTQSKTRGGSLFRLITVIQQLELTYDLYSMNSEEILQLLPEEFDNWKDLQPVSS